MKKKEKETIEKLQIAFQSALGISLSVIEKVFGDGVHRLDLDAKRTGRALRHQEADRQHLLGLS